MLGRIRFDPAFGLRLFLALFARRVRFVGCVNMNPSQHHPFEARAREGESRAGEGSATAPEPSASAADAPPLAFEPALAELESIVARMESGELSLEQSLTAYKRGAQLLHYCQAALKDAQQQVKILEAGLLQDFTGGAEQA